MNFKKLYAKNCYDLDPRISAITGDLQQDPYLLRMKEYTQHGTVSTYMHSIAVARLCYVIGCRIKTNINLTALLRSALLHDYYLYDWHNPDHPRWHGFCHPHKAAENAKHDFSISTKEYNSIKSHMWPLTFRCIPRTREAWILTCADKVCSTWETLFMRKPVNIAFSV